MIFSDLLFFSPAGAEAYEAMRESFRGGYLRVRGPWPAEEEIDTFLAARQLWRANWVACFEAPQALRFNTWLAGLLERFQATGRLRR